MKLKILFLAFVIAILVGCNKDHNNTTTQTRTELLTSKVWIYDEIYNNWQQPNQIFTYKRGRANNTVNWDKSRVIFYKDGSFDEILPNGTLSAGGTWQLLNNDTQLKTIVSGGTTNTANIDTLTTDRLVWTDLTNKVHASQIWKK